MATETDSTCPICQDTRNDVASALPCRHQFCLGCILRWAQRIPSCPLCRRMIQTIRFSEQSERDYIQLIIASPEGSPEAHSQAERAPGHQEDNSPHSPVASPPSSPQETLSPDEQGASRLELVGDLLPEVWAGLFREQQQLLDPVRPWLRQRLDGIYWGRWWLIEATESCILRYLCICGPDAEVLVQRLLVFLEEHTALLVHGLINAIAEQCSEEAQRLLHSHTVEDEDGSPAASTSSSSSSSSSESMSSRSQKDTPVNCSADSNVEEETATVETGPHQGPSCPQPEPIPAEKDQPQEESEQAALPGPSAQGCSHSHSTPGQGRGCSPGATQCAQKRRVPSPLDSPQPRKKP
ncbi:E3 ubiquitin-protein ligase Topors-like [Myiozetetes cayanensis]|uniref:E3 ubiquitin-protein ligase Topors-like n=1 Tax=Myiozetetes cayanensis TaxID=478635 RepID=UPI00215F2D48|nr:E3 ubiquitin-protein ligase Topors-like [Myiozetetes cayanensis]